MTTLTFILVIGVIWSVTSKRKREDILSGFLETDQPSGGWRESPDCSGRLLREWGALPAESFRRDNDLKSHRPRRLLSLRGRNYSGSDGVLSPGLVSKPPRLCELRMSDNFTLSDTVRADAPSVAVLLPVGLEAQRQ
jgi:hypothetical protein